MEEFISDFYKELDKEILKSNDNTAKGIYRLFLTFRDQITNWIVAAIRSEPQSTIKLIEKFHNRLHEEMFF